jgi:ferredoxin-type protein NapH
MPQKGSGPAVTRRQFLQVAGVAVFGMALSAGERASGLAPKVLRPPGALPETSFKAVCNRCGRCIKVCPNMALQPMPLREGIDTFETPWIIPRQANCSLCLECQIVCPTGAIERVPVEQVNMGKAVIDKDRCLAWSHSKDCFVCGEQCLRLAIHLEGISNPVIQPDLCVGCGTCERNCPVEGIAAIRVTPR